MQRRAETATSCLRSSATWLMIFLAVVFSGTGCGTTENSTSESSGFTPAPRTAELPPPSSSAATNGLIPLPTPEQVLSSVPEGRTDPFAPTVVALSPASSQGDPVSAPTKDFSVQGVVAVGGELRALVSIPDASGTVCVGPRGRCPGAATALLPIGWTVQSIDLGRGCLRLSIAGQSQRRCIA